MTIRTRNRRRPANSRNTSEPTASGRRVDPDPALDWSRDLALSVEFRPVPELQPASRNARTHSKKQIHQIAASIREFGFVNPILVDATGRVLAGH